MDPQQVINGVTKLCTFPEIAEKFNVAVQNPLTSNQELEDIILEDAALTSRLLRIANSAMFSFPSKIDTVSKAITIIGHRQTSEIILACSIVQVFKDIAPEDMDMQGFWHHSIATGAAARLLALRAKESNIERFFTLGLLHDIGRLILLMRLPNKMKEVIALGKEKQSGLHEAEKEVLGYDHTRIGSMMLRQWKLPERICEPVAYHHFPSLSQGYKFESGILHVADFISHAMHYGNNVTEVIPRFNEKAWEILNLDVDIIPAVIEQTEIQHKEAVRFILSEDI